MDPVLRLVKFMYLIELHYFSSSILLTTREDNEIIRWQNWSLALSKGTEPQRELKRA